MRPPAFVRRLLVPLGLALGLSVVVGTAPGSATGAVPTPSASASSRAPGSVHYGWTTAPVATRYRLLWSAKPYGNFLDRPTAWLSSSARRATLRVGSAYSSDAGQRAIQTALPYGNPLYARVQTTNGRSVRNSAWTGGVFPAIPTPAAGDSLRVGTYNLGQSTDASRIAAAIRGQGLHVVSLQEVKGYTAYQVAWELGWDATQILPGQQQQVIYDASMYDASDVRTVAMHNYKGGPALVAPSVRLRPVDGGRAFWVVSAHLVVDPRASLVTRNAQNSADAVALANGLTRFTGADPVVVAGDFTANREPYMIPTAANPGGGQQVFVSRGYWDTRAALGRRGVGYSTFNRRSYPQPASPVGVSSRSDYIMTKGIRGAITYVNLANQRSPVSDHNLVWSEVRVPR